MALDLLSLTSAAILAIPETAPERLFSAPGRVEAEFRALVRRWHPDNFATSRLPDFSTAVLPHVNGLHAAARRRIADGTWRMPGSIALELKDGRTRRIDFVRQDEFELGQVFVGRDAVTYALDGGFADLMPAALRAIKGLRFADTAMRREIAPRLPMLREAADTVSGALLSIERPADAIRLGDLLAYYGGRLDARHVAWIVSEMLNLACYLDWAGLVHNDISPETVFVSPARHAIMLLGGWWYAAAEGAPMHAAPARTVACAPASVTLTKRATHRTDLELVRATARTLLGDAPASVPMRDWLRFAASGRALDDYRDWQAVLADSFGRRRFTPMTLTATDIYEGV